MPSILNWLLAAGVVLTGCNSEPRAPRPPEFTQAFSSLPLPPNPEFVSRAGGADALQITVRSSAEMTQVADFYRGVLTQGNWRLVSDIKNADGSTALYAEQDGPPLWVKIWQAGDRPGTMVQLTGAVIAQDSAKPPRKADTGAKPGAKPSS
jgi:hypothetical protein